MVSPTCVQPISASSFMHVAHMSNISSTHPSFEVVGGGTKPPPTTRVGQPRRGAQVLVRSTRTFQGWLRPWKPPTHLPSTPLTFPETRPPFSPDPYRPHPPSFDHIYLPRRPYPPPVSITPTLPPCSPVARRKPTIVRLWHSALSGIEAALSGHFPFTTHQVCRHLQTIS